MSFELLTFNSFNAEGIYGNGLLPFLNTKVRIYYSGKSRQTYAQAQFGLGRGVTVFAKKHLGSNIDKQSRGTHLFPKAVL